MALNLLPELEILAEEVGQLAGESPNEAIRHALEERKERLALRVVRGGDRKAQIRHWLETEVWPQIPAEALGRRLSRAEEDEILGYGPAGA
ncbi:MAG TPA: protein transcription factor [Thermoanaerobaculia bacterium]|jgi:antitoxin VapB|nr:protein transcription factor [Thermoanaerobaculia bacterium]